jgi:large subunit ribosomal protein L17
MRHSKSKGLKNRFTSWQKATLKSLAKNIIIHQSIRTSLAKAKAVRPLVDKLIQLAKENTLTAKREAFSILGDHDLVVKLFAEMGPRFKDNTGGCTRIIQLARRRGDDAQIVVFELTQIKKVQKKKAKKEKTAEPVQEEEQAEDREVVAEKETEKVKLSEEKKHPVSQKPGKKFLGGLRNIFKKERDAL